MIYNTIKINRILNPTAIDIGEYVINPYRGCSFGCLYCYVRHNKNTLKNKKNWGEYVDARINAPELLEKEISNKKPKCVLMGSTTECFQPAESQYHITEKILEILNRRNVFYSILTRSPSIADYIPLLNRGFCRQIYFTVNDYEDKYKKLLEPSSPCFNDRIDAILKLKSHGLSVMPYFSPVFPYISKIENTCKILKPSERIEFECLNFNLGNISAIIDAVISVSQEIGLIYKNMLSDEKCHNLEWDKIKKYILQTASRHKINHCLYAHNFNMYFNNRYAQ